MYKIHMYGTFSGHLIRIFEKETLEEAVKLADDLAEAPGSPVDALVESPTGRIVHEATWLDNNPL